MYSKRRQRRIKALRDQGFTKLEAREISRIKKYPPYVVMGIMRRAAAYQTAMSQGISERQFLKRIRNSYIVDGNYKMDKLGRKRIDVWKLVRQWEDSYKDDHRDYETPSKKGSNPVRDFDDRSLEHRPGE